MWNKSKPCASVPAGLSATLTSGAQDVAKSLRPRGAVRRSCAFASAIELSCAVAAGTALAAAKDMGAIKRLTNGTRISTALLAMTLGIGVAAAQSTVSRCADCHFANPGSASLWHLSDWENSAHGRKGVGCEGCHGGDQTTFESLPAHRGILKSTQFGSPMHRMNIPKTCGTCHPGPFRAFQQSKHYELLREGNRDVPTCTTCHGNAGAYLLSPKALSAECFRCHGPGKVAPRTDYPPEGKIHLAMVREIRQTLDDAATLIKRIKPREARTRREAELREARESLSLAVYSAHMFVFDEMNTRLEKARARADALLMGLKTPEQPASQGAASSTPPAVRH